MLTSDAGFALIRATHIAAGALALCAGPGAMLTRKGALWHRRCGKAYFWAMAWIAASGLVMSLMHERTFLFMVGLFSFYLAFTGYRALHTRKLGQSPALMDHVALGIALLAALAFMLWSQGVSSELRVVARVFGGILLALAAADLYRFIRPATERMAWRQVHMVRMLASYIATATAFAVVNLSFLPSLVIWLTPTVVGTVGITAWVTYYRLRDAR